MDRRCCHCEEAQPTKQSVPILELTDCFVPTPALMRGTAFSMKIRKGPLRSQ